jgi:hypothetical protein
MGWLTCWTGVGHRGGIAHDLGNEEEDKGGIERLRVVCVYLVAL